MLVRDFLKMHTGYVHAKPKDRFLIYSDTKAAN